MASSPLVPPRNSAFGLKALRRLIGRLALAMSLAVTPVAAQAQQGMSLIRDTEIEAILKADSKPILEAAGINPDSIEILIIGSRELNAFAGPGRMGFFTGLILESENPNQLQGVIAHEVGHLAAGHSARSGDMQRVGLQPFLLTMGLGVLAAFAGAGDAAIALMSSASQFGTLAALGYSREQESRADQAGLTILDRAGLSGRGLVEFFDNFRYQEVFQEARRYAYFRSHPLSSDRIDTLRRKAETLPDWEKVDSEEAMERHRIMQAKLQGFLNPQRAIVEYSETDTSYPARYARAIAYYQMKEPDRALRLIDALLTEQPENAYLWELKGQILFEFGRTREAEAPQRRSVELMPEAPLLRVNLGQTLIAMNDDAKLEEGVNELRRALTQENDNAVAWRLLAEGYDRRGEDGSARLATAEYNFHIGDRQQARVFAMRARDLLTRDTPEWRRATDIVLTSNPSREDLRELAQEGAIASGSVR